MTLERIVDAVIIVRDHHCTHTAAARQAGVSRARVTLPQLAGVSITASRPYVLTILLVEGASSFGLSDASQHGAATLAVKHREGNSEASKEGTVQGARVLGRERERDEGAPSRVQCKREWRRRSSSTLRR